MVLEESEERALQAGRAVKFCRPELYLKGSDAMDVPVSTDTTHPTPVTPIACKSTSAIHSHAF